MAFVFQVREVKIWRRSFHPIARVFGSDQRVVAAKNELHRHRERGELVVGPYRKPLHTGTKVLKPQHQGLGYFARQARASRDEFL